MIHKTKTTLSIAATMGCFALAATSANAAIILADDFADADRSSSDGTIGAWNTVSGISAPSTTLQFFKGGTTNQAALFDNAANDADGAFDVNNNMTADGWDTTITLAVGGADISLTSLDLDLKLTNGSGAAQDTGNKTGQMLVEFFDAGDSSVGTADLGGNQSYPTVSYQRTLDLTGISLSAGQTYTMVVSARGTGFGHHKAFDAIELNGTVVPEPSSAALLGLGGLALILRRRK